MNTSCSCQLHKHCHDTIGQAKAHLRGMLRKDPDCKCLVYGCDCGHYHIGNQKENVHKNKYHNKVGL